MYAYIDHAFRIHTCMHSCIYECLHTYMNACIHHAFTNKYMCVPYKHEHTYMHVKAPLKQPKKNYVPEYGEPLIGFYAKS